MCIRDSIYRNDDVYSSGVYEKFKTEADVKGLEIVSATTFTDASSNDCLLYTSFRLDWIFFRKLPLQGKRLHHVFNFFQGFLRLSAQMCIRDRPVRASCFFAAAQVYWK